MKKGQMFILLTLKSETVSDALKSFDLKFSIVSSSGNSQHLINQLLKCVCGLAQFPNETCTIQ